MEKYWELDLEFEKAEGEYVFTEHMLEGYLEKYLTYKKFNEYELDSYIRSEVISKTTECDFLSRSGEPYEYLKVIRRFIIPSEVIISEKMYMYQAAYKNVVLDEIKIEYSIRYVVDEDEMILKPSEIIYYREEMREPYVYFSCDALRKVNDKKSILYDKELEKYKYYRKYTDDEEVSRINLSGTKAKERIESYCRNLTYPVTPVENVEQVMI